MALWETVSLSSVDLQVVLKHSLSIWKIVIWTVFSYFTTVMEFEALVLIQ